LVKGEAFTEKDMKILALVRDRPDWRGLYRLWEAAIAYVDVPIRNGEVHD
jgi:hypothetical protein